MPETDNDTPKVAIVTGASQGLGEGIARGYRARGWRVVGVSRSIMPADEGDWLKTCNVTAAEAPTKVKGASFYTNLSSPWLKRVAV